MKPVVYTVFSITIYFYDPREELLFFALLNSFMCAAMLQQQQQQIRWQRSGSRTKGRGRKDDRTEEKLPERTQRETSPDRYGAPDSSGTGPHRRVWAATGRRWSGLEPGTVTEAFLARITQRNTPR